MKIKVKEKSYEEALKLSEELSLKPKKPNILFRTILAVASLPDIWATKFKLNKIGMERLKKGEPALYLMNHSCFLDLKIASTQLYPKPFNIVCTSDGFVGKRWLMRNLGCIPTNKFVTDTKLVRNMQFAFKTLKSSVLMYPEASYSFDGTETPLPDSLGKCIKLLQVPVVMIKTYGAFHRDPLYNGLRLRKVKVTADMEYVLSVDEINQMSPTEIQEKINACFKLDNFKWQQENGIIVAESFRAEGLNRVLYKCPHCKLEGKMQASGSNIKCTACGKEYTLTEQGFMQALNGETEFSHIPDWYSWEREAVKNEIEQGNYRLEKEVDIYMLVNMKAIYKVGEGKLLHTPEGFSLVGCDGKLNYSQKPTASYGLYADYLWYEIADTICIGDKKALYYCFPKDNEDIVAKTRLAAEEMYKLAKRKLHEKQAVAE